MPPLGYRSRYPAESMVNPIDDLTDCGDRFEGVWSLGSTDVIVSVDKPNVNSDTASILKQLRERLKETLDVATEYFAKNKSRYEVDYIDDLSDPQIILGTDTYSVIWCSDKGEVNCEGVIGIDFQLESQLPFDMMVGD